jgi:hypothetical protein
MIDINGLGSLLAECSGPQIYIGNNSAPLAGMVRYYNGQLEVFDGMIWHPIRKTIRVRLQDGAEESIAWARKKMQEEKELQQLIDEYPNVKDLKEKLDILVALVREEKKNG